MGLPRTVSSPRHNRDDVGHHVEHEVDVRESDKGRGVEAIGPALCAAIAHQLVHAEEDRGGPVARRHPGHDGSVVGILLGGRKRLRRKVRGAEREAGRARPLLGGGLEPAGELSPDPLVVGPFLLLGEVLEIPFGAPEGHEVGATRVADLGPLRVDFGERRALRLGRRRLVGRREAADEAVPDGKVEARDDA